jgi:putative ATPase
MDLFETETKSYSLNEPLAARMRPRNLSEFIGQQHILAPGKLLKRAIESDKLTSLVFYGPPGTGKTTLAGVIAKETKRRFVALNAVSSGVAELRKVLEEARLAERKGAGRTILFIDEIHRFNKSQQDVLMPDVERGNPVLIGATTQNPFFSIVPALLSRSLVFELKPHSNEDLQKVLQQALKDTERGLGKKQIDVDADALAFWAELADGDARRALSALELAVLTTPPTAGVERIHITRSIAEESIQKKAVVYDDGDAHYDTISAYIKSMRGSDPDAAIYWLAKMLYAGEDLRFIARRLVICASEDIGNADPQALLVAQAAAQAVEFIGMPEGRIPLAQATVYLACSPKSNASYLAINEAMQDVESGKTLQLPESIKDAHYKGAKRLGHGEGYQYAHDYENHYVEQTYAPTDKRYYTPGTLGFEKKFQDYLAEIRKISH